MVAELFVLLQYTIVNWFGYAQNLVPLLRWPLAEGESATGCFDVSRGVVNNFLILLNVVPEFF